MTAAPRGPRSWLRFLPALLLAALFLYGLSTGAVRHFSLTELKVHYHELHLAAAEHPVAAASAFLGILVVAVASGLPVALMLTVAGGAIFGAWLGAGLTMVGATVGATATYAAARFAVGGAFQRYAERASGPVRRAIAGFERNAFGHILTMRLIPLFPFSPVNVAAGLAGVPARPFVLATLVGEVPTASIYCSFGAGLGRMLAQGERPNIRSLEDPQLILPLVGLALLSLAPTVVRALRRPRTPPGA